MKSDFPQLFVSRLNIYWRLCKLLCSELYKRQILGTCLLSYAKYRCEYCQSADKLRQYFYKVIFYGEVLPLKTRSR